MKGFICLLNSLSAVMLALLSVAHVQGETFNVTVEEGVTFTGRCDYSDVIWNVTKEGQALTVAWCYSGQCYLTNPYNERYYVGLYDKSSPEYPARKSFIIIQGISRTITKIQCNLANIITRTWLTAVIVRPRLIECLTPTKEPTDRDNNFIIRVTCSFEVFPAGNCSIAVQVGHNCTSAVQGLLDVYQTETDLDHTLLYSTHTYRTTCIHSLYVYEAKWDKETYFQVTAYPDVSSGRKFNTTSPWIRLPNEEVTKVMDFTLNNRSNGAMVYSDQTVVVQCVGQGDPGAILELFQRDPYKQLHSVSLPRVLTYVIQGPSCGASYGLGCRVGSDERYLDLNTLICSSNDDTYLMAVIITLAMAILLVAIIVFCCIRMRLRLRRQRSRGPGRQHATPTHSCPSPEESSAPPAYHEIFSIDVPQDTQGPPDYWSLPPPYSASELTKTEVEQITLGETPRTQSETPMTHSETPRTHSETPGLQIETHRTQWSPETTQTQV
ncbi:hypothetical protein Btru_006858 [Bulinus truncatus]|nr:hypothetical protein Btru_006858 [Bulinus truncatus]